MKILIKLGGTLLDAPDSRRRLADEIRGILANGTRAVVVHGGGAQMTRFLGERNVESRFVNGLRVTTPEVLDAVLKVYAGSVNHELVASFTAAGVPAVGLSGLDALLTEAEPLGEEYGAVGKPSRSRHELLDLLTQNSYLPVVACVAGDAAGHIYNVNADQMAVSCATGFGASRLFFLTDVDGVRGSDGAVFPVLRAAEAEELIADGVATGGMRAKLDAGLLALAGGVEEVRIAPGKVPGTLRRLLGGEAAGTRLIA